jgi:hypothetical protein
MPTKSRTPKKSANAIAREKERAAQKRARDAETKRKAKLLRDKGLIYEGRDFRKQKVTKHMRAQVKRFEAALSPDVVVIKGTPKEISRVRAGSDVIASTRKAIVVPAEPGRVKTIRDGMRATVTPLANGTTIEELTIPDGKTMSAMIKFLASPEGDAIKAEREWYSFKVYDNYHAKVYPNARALLDTLKVYEQVRERKNSFASPDAQEPEAEVTLYRVYPKGAWEKMLKQREKEYAKKYGYTLAAYRKRKESDRRAAKRAQKRNKQKVKQKWTPEKESQYRAIKAEQSKTREAARIKQRSTEPGYKERQAQAARKRRAKKKDTPK